LIPYGRDIDLKAKEDTLLFQFVDKKEERKNNDYDKKELIFQ